MGASNSRLEEDKSLQLCRSRKKFIKQALNGRCSLAAAHIGYIEELKIVGSALRRFVEFDSQFETLAHSSTCATPEPHSLKSISRLSFSSRSLSQNVDAIGNLSPPSSTPVSTQFQSHHMKFRSSFSTKVEEKPPVPIAVSVSSTTPTTTPRSTETPEASPFETAEATENSPWDYFGLFHPIDQHLPTQEGHGFDDEIRHQRVEGGARGIDNTEDKLSSDGIEDSQISDDEFDEPTTATLVRSFKNVNRSIENLANEDSSSIPSENRVSETMLSSAENVKGTRDATVNGVSPPQPSEISEIKLMNGKNNNNSPDLSPLRAASSRFVHLDDVKITPVKQTEVEDQVVPKDFLSSMKTIDQLFAKASESGKEVPKMLEANKFHFRPVIHGKQGGSATSSLMKSCFSCGDDPSQIPQEPPQESVKYLTWHRTTSSRSASSRNLLGVNSRDGAEDLGKNLFDNFCMVSGSHASTLDRLYAWEKKLYDEVKAGQILKSNFDQKCRLLRQQESQGENTDKTRAAVKGLHSRIRVAVQRIASISKKIEEIRDRELQPQLEELIEGLRKMWEMMLECHKLQLHTISVSQMPGSMKIIIQSDSRKQITIHLKNELSYLSSIFTKWINAQKLYVESINKWLFKCVLLPQNTSKRNKRMRPPPIQNMGPPIYMICGAWLEMFDKLPAKGVVDSIKDLEVEVAHFLPHQEKSQGKAASTTTTTTTTTILGDEISQDRTPALDSFRTSLAGFLGQLNNFAESSERMFSELQKAIQEAKNNYEQFKSQQL
ncbi:nitrate regulatory gene2 protein-like [Salvia splendens]|uniref:nitrate regulatory gene2 protein-like n=1 Tax=Salvia splendens TaxID=180675 RepID=UPI001100352A|nr:nitrate regulatory gene2 protein-like [Salvia splendens]XP_042003212.1 nitrate regulatory gene2 protein-like [Salvia splendens]XP_042003213.1 nitrate regulatory gene2 protein-like [Salvia splendens]XP_042003214.1 nitrate regulatory gene2 protein-like [Salvia splendens]XP_042003215.1 nitrate regulatory gene2 protein-like [Salvia splendens]